MQQETLSPWEERLGIAALPADVALSTRAVAEVIEVRIASQAEALLTCLLSTAAV